MAGCAYRWDQALTEIAENLTVLKEEFDPSVLGGIYWVHGAENRQMAGLPQRFRAAFGSPNFFSVGAAHIPFKKVKIDDERLAQRMREK